MYLQFLHSYLFHVSVRHINRNYHSCKTFLIQLQLNLYTKILLLFFFFAGSMLAYRLYTLMRALKHEYYEASCSRIFAERLLYLFKKKRKLVVYQVC